MSNYIVGLDIGTTKIACFVGERAPNDKIRIIGFGKTESVGVERGIVKNIKDTAKSIQKAVADASEMAKYDITEVYVGIAGHHIKSRTNHGSIMIPEEHRQIERSDVERLIENQYRLMLEPGEEIIHVFPQTFIVDNDMLDVEINPVGVAGKCLEANFHIVTGNAANIRNIRDAVVLAGLTIKGVVLEPIASAYAVLDERDKNAGVALVDIGGGTTDIAIFQDGIIRHTSVLPLAGNIITQDIHDNCKILKHQAESLKTKFGSCLPNCVNEDIIISIPGIRNQEPREISVKTLAGIIKGRMQLILEQVQYEIQTSNFEQHLIAGVVLTGGGARMKNIKELSEIVIGIDSRIGTPDEHLDQQGSVTFEDLSHPMYATGIGLVIYGILEKEENERSEKEKKEASMDSIEEIAPTETPSNEVKNEEEDAPKDKKTNRKNRRVKVEKEQKKSNNDTKGSWYNNLKTWLTDQLSDGLDE